MEANPSIPFVGAFDISARGRIDPHSGWHAAEKRVNGLAARSAPDRGTPLPQPAWPALLEALGGSIQLANRRLAELQPTLRAANAIIEALNGLPYEADYAELERVLGLREPRESHDRIGDAMNRVMHRLAQHREDAHRFLAG